MRRRVQLDPIHRFQHGTAGVLEDAHVFLGDRWGQSGAVEV